MDPKNCTDYFRENKIGILNLKFFTLLLINVAIIRGKKLKFKLNFR